MLRGRNLAVVGHKLIAQLPGQNCQQLPSKQGTRAKIFPGRTAFPDSDKCPSPIGTSQPPMPHKKHRAEFPGLFPSMPLKVNPAELDWLMADLA